MRNIIEKTAKEYGVTTSEVEREIGAAIAIGMESEDQFAREFWRKLSPDGEDIDMGTVIAVLASMVKPEFDE